MRLGRDCRRRKLRWIRLEPLGKSEVATTVLGGNSADFPGRAEWEEKMYAEKTTYVRAFAAVDCGDEGSVVADGGDEFGRSEGYVVQRSEGGFADAEDEQLMQLAQKTEAEFQGVIERGAGVGGASGEVGREGDTAGWVCGWLRLRSFASLRMTAADNLVLGNRPESFGAGSRAGCLQGSKNRRRDARRYQFQFTIGLCWAYGFLTLGFVFPYGGLPNV